MRQLSKLFAGWSWDGCGQYIARSRLVVAMNPIQIRAVLGRDHEGTSRDDDALIMRLLNEGAPTWITKAIGEYHGDHWALVSRFTINVYDLESAAYSAGIVAVWRDRAWMRDEVVKMRPHSERAAQKIVEALEDPANTHHLWDVVAAVAERAEMPRALVRAIAGDRVEVLANEFAAAYAIEWANAVEDEASAAKARAAEGASKLCDACDREIVGDGHTDALVLTDAGTYFHLCDRVRCQSKRSMMGLEQRRALYKTTVAARAARGAS